MNGLRLASTCSGSSPFQLPRRNGRISSLGSRRLGRSSALLPFQLGSTRRSSTHSLRVHAFFNNNDNDNDDNKDTTSKWDPLKEAAPLLDAIYAKVQSLADALVAALQTVWEFQRQCVQRAWARSLIAWTIALGIVTAATNVWGLPALNRRLPHMATQAATILQRDVEIGHVRWLAPTGITGLHPLGSVGPISVGAGPIERSSATLDRVSLGVNPLQSLLRGRIVLSVKAAGAEVHLQQGDNYSWFGFPDDTFPSSRNFLPGLTTTSDDDNGENGGGGSDGGGGDGGDGGGISIAPPSSSSSSSSSRRHRRSRIPQSTTNTHRSSSSNIIAASVPSLQQQQQQQQQQQEEESNFISSESFLSTIANELLAWHAAQDRAAEQAFMSRGGGGSTAAAAETLLLLSTSGGSGIPIGGGGGSSTSGSGGIPTPSSESDTPSTSTSTSAAVVGEEKPQSKSWKSFLPFRTEIAHILSSPPFSPAEMKKDDERVENSGADTESSSSSSFVIINGGEGDTATAKSKGAVPTRQEHLDALNSIQLTVNRNSQRVSSGGGGDGQGQPTTTADDEDSAFKHQKQGNSDTTNAPVHEMEFAEGDTYSKEERNLLLPSQSTTIADTDTTSTAQPHLMASKRGAAMLNALPSLNLNIHSKLQSTPPPPPQQQLQERVELPPSSLTSKINSLGGLSTGPVAPPTKIVRNGERLARFQDTVLDQATVRRKALGSKALQQSRNWKPAKAPITPSPSDNQYSAVPGGAGVSGLGNVQSSDGTAAPSSSSTPSDELFHSDEAHEHHKNHSNHKMNIMHPGYFPPSPGPVYTPAPPEALAELRAKQRTVGTLLHEVLGAVGALVQRSLVVGSIDLTQGTLYGHIHGEELPRVFENVTTSVRLGPGYDTLDVEIKALPHARNPASHKCTMPNPKSHRHLRDYTGLTALHALEEQAQIAAARVDEEEDGSESPSSSSTSKVVPDGGHVQVLVSATGLADNDLATNGPRVPDLTITVRGQNLHAPLVERIFELPMDINAGRANGEFIIKMHDYESWYSFPEFYGRVAVRGANFHFWDATDDIMDADLDLLFEGDRLYLHRAKGRFGDVKMTLTGDLDLDPLTGQYRLSATVPHVEINALRATLGVRPTPFPVAGAVGGTLHVTGPLEKPVFSGRAKVIRPTVEALSDCEPTNALETLLLEPDAIAAYDKVPLASAELVFSLDMATETMTLHEFKASPVGGGVLFGSGTLGTSPASETDPAALSISAQGSGLPAEALAERYLPEGAHIPPGLLVGKASVSATMRGAHLAPVIDVAFSMPEGSVSGSVKFTRDSSSVSIASPYVDGAGTVFLRPPSFAAAKAAVTQAQATELAKPNLAGCDADVTMRGLDIVPLISDEDSRQRLARQSGEPVRLKVNGRAKIVGTVSTSAANKSTTVSISDASDAATPVEAATSAAADPWQFSGTLDLENLKLNQLKLYRALKGSLKLSNSQVAVHAKGVRPDEVLDIDLSLPLLPEQQLPEQLLGKEQERGRGAVAATATAATVLDGEKSNETTPSTTPPPAATAAGSSVSVRCGQLLAAATMDATGSQLDIRVANVKLDELELVSLRGELQEVSCSLNFQAQTGRGRLSLAGPRYSGLRGDSLSGGFRWERDVVRLEKLVLQQRRSKYEVQGEYVVPPSVPLPTSAADLARRQAEQAEQRKRSGGANTPSLPVAGRWRLRVDVPTADMQEILPAARLLQSATSRRPADYERAKSAFISAVKEIALRAQDLNGQLRDLAEKIADVSAAQALSSSTVGGGGGGASSSSTSAAAQFQLPALQDVKGHWNGSIQAFGGGGGATSCEFDVRGGDWQWGQATLDAVVAAGNYHSEEGVQLQEFVLKSGDAKLLVRGSLLSDHQDATVLLTDFPMTKLRPLFRAMPALKNAAPAASAKVPEPVASPLPLGMLANALGQASQGLEGISSDADSPINGMLYVSGTLGGSKDAPSGEIAVRLFDAAVGATRLAQAQASARLSESMQLSFNVDVVPVEGHRKSGHIRAAGSIPLAPHAPPPPPPPTQESTASSSTGGDGDGLPSSMSTTTTPPPTPSAAPGMDPATTTTTTTTTTPTGPLDVRVSVRDSGMAVLTSMAPDFKWQSGEADLSFKLTGTVDQPTVTGTALINKAIINCPLLKYPLQVVSADVRCRNGMMEVETVDARVGRKGHIRVRGILPVYQSKQVPHGAAPVLAAMQHRLTLDVKDLELRVRNIYTGQLDALVTVRDSVERPLIGGSVRFSRGSVYLLPQGQDVAGSSSGGGGGGGATTSTSTGSSSNTGLSNFYNNNSTTTPPSGRPTVAKLFDLLTRRESGLLASRLEDAVRQEVEAVEQIVTEAAGQNVMLDALALQFGPDLRAVYPLVLNFGIAGELITSGPAHPDAVSVEGVLKLPSGDVNLVAAKLEVDREHVNMLTFGGAGAPPNGVDPFVDVVLVTGDLRLSVRGRASEWADHFVLQSIGKTSAGGDGEQLDASEAARVLSNKLKATLLGDDGQLVLSRLAGSTVSTLLPKIETQGTVGGASWRLVSAPAIPGLLDPLLSDPSNLLGSITMGTEVEVQFGRKLQAAMVRKPRETDVNTQWTLNYLLNSKLRMQFNISSAPPYSKTLMFQYSSEGSG